MNKVLKMPLRETMDQLATVAAELNRESDGLNAVIDDFEEQLEHAGVGVSLWLNERCALDESDWREHFNEHTENTWQECSARLLGYAKIDGKWRVAVKEVVLTKTGSADQWGNEGIEITVRGQSNVTPLAQASRAIRVEAVAHFEDLAKALIERMKSHLADIASAKKLIKEGS